MKEPINLCQGWKSHNRKLKGSNGILNPKHQAIWETISMHTVLFPLPRENQGCKNK